MNKIKGTPKNLTDALKDGLDHAMVGYSDAEIELIRQHVQDYLAQKFTHTAFLSDEEHQAKVLNLFKACTKTDKEAA